MKLRSLALTLLFAAAPAAALDPELVENPSHRDGESPWMLVVKSPAHAEWVRHQTRYGNLDIVLTAATASKVKLIINDEASRILTIAFSQGEGKEVVTELEFGVDGRKEAGALSLGEPSSSDRIIGSYFSRAYSLKKLEDLGHRGYADLLKGTEPSHDGRLMLLALGYAVNLEARREMFFAQTTPEQAWDALADEARLSRAHGSDAGSVRHAYRRIIGALDVLAADGDLVVVDYNLKPSPTTSGPHGVMTREDYLKAYGSSGYVTLVGHSRKLDGVDVTSSLADAVEFVEKERGMRFDDETGLYYR